MTLIILSCLFKHFRKIQTHENTWTFSTCEHKFNSANFWILFTAWMFFFLIISSIFLLINILCVCSCSTSLSAVVFLDFLSRPARWTILMITPPNFCDLSPQPSKDPYQRTNKKYSKGITPLKHTQLLNTMSTTTIDFLKF